MSTLLFYLPFLVAYSIIAIYAERKLSAFMQDRLGPMEVGYYGIAQSIADLLKLIQKEDIVPAKADAALFKVAPIIIFATVFAGFSVLPLTPDWHGSSAASGIFLLLAIVSLDVFGIVIAGWSSNNKYTILGTFRSAAQIVSYEVPLGLSVVCVCIVCESLNLQEISIQQGSQSSTANYLFGIPIIETTSWGGIFNWNVFKMPVLFFAWIVFFISSLAESNRAPFDLPVAESEIVAGFYTEYTGFRWAVIMLAEYGIMLLVSILGAVLFFGSWSTPFPNVGVMRLGDWTSGEPGSIASSSWGIFWLMSKSVFFVFLQMWIRWTYPRLRVDQLMALSWKYLTPFALLLVILCGLWKILIL